MSALSDAITAAQALVESEYTAETWADFEIAYYGAVAVQNDRFAGVTLMTAATAALTEAVEDLVPETVATPTSDPEAGAVLIGAEVELACATEGATIYYTTDGSAPDEDSTAYTGPIELSEATTIKAKAYKGAMTGSAVLTAAFTIAVVATPTATPGAGEVADNSEVALASETEGATIYYTVDGSTPDNTDTEYTEPIVITDDVTIKAIAVKTGMTDSEVLTAGYTVAT